MDEITKTDDQANSSKPGRSADGFGMMDVVAMADTVRMADVPLLNFVGALIVVPLMKIGIVGTIWSLTRWLRTHLGPWLDYRRDLNGEAW